MEFKKEKPLYFESSGRLVTILGRESISNPNIALIESVKNGYDADAKKVSVIFKELKESHHLGKIVVNDNGNGMTLEEIRDTWMKPATDNKVQEPLSKKYKRHKIGEKGIARFALSTLAQKTEITTQTAGITKGYRLLVDWSKFEEDGGSFERIPVELSSFKKKKKEHGTKVELSGLRQRWSKKVLEKFIQEAELITPPTSRPENFEIDILIPDFPDISDQKLNSKFLKIAPYFFEANLDEKGFLKYKVRTPQGTKRYPRVKTTKYSCGPANFSFWFLPRDKGPYERLGVSLQSINIDEIKKFLDDWSGIKIYRDNLRVKPYGDSGNDWLGLESLRVNNPSVIPGNEQVFGYVEITKKDNPAIVDTSTRESIVGNTEFRDLKEFAVDSIRFFGSIRSAVEQKRKHKSKRKKKGPQKPRNLNEILPKKLVLKPREAFIDFGKKYPEIFYIKLEDEINGTYNYNLPNATLILSRKVVENLIYNLFEEKFPQNADFRWDSRRKQALGFGKLVSNLSEQASSFNEDQVVLVKKVVTLISRFRKEANTHTHQIIEYLDDRSELKKLKIPEIIEILLKLIKKAKEEK